MAITQEKNILPLSIHGKIRIVFHNIEIQRGEKFRATQGPAGVTALNRMHHANNISAYLCGNIFKFTHNNQVCGWLILLQTYLNS